MQADIGVTLYWSNRKIVSNCQKLSVGGERSSSLHHLRLRMGLPTPWLWTSVGQCMNAILCMDMQLVANCCIQSDKIICEWFVIMKKKDTDISKVRM